MQPNIHSTAIISPESAIDSTVTVGPYAIIDEKAVIGGGTVIGPCAHVFPFTQIGKNCRLHDGCALGNIPQDLKFGHEQTRLIIGDQNVIREFVTVNRGTSATGETVIGRHCLLMAYAHVAHDCRIGDHVVLANAVQLAGHVIIDDFAGVGGMVPVHQFVRIGKYAFIGGGYRVAKDVPPYVLAAGEPLRFAGLNYTGLKRNGFTADQIRLIEKIYFIIYQSRLYTAAALTRIRESFDLTGVVSEIVSFFENSDRGVIRR